MKLQLARSNLYNNLNFASSQKQQCRNLKILLKIEIIVSNFKASAIWPEDISIFKATACYFLLIQSHVEKYFEKIKKLTKNSLL